METTIPSFCYDILSISITKIMRMRRVVHGITMIIRNIRINLLTKNFQNSAI